MECRNNNITPRERVDDSMLLRILDEDVQQGCLYRSSMKNDSRIRNMSYCRQSARAETGSGSESGCATINALSGNSLAMVYAPDQEWKDLYCDEDAMTHGTLFAELYKPFYHGCNGSCK